MKPTRTRDWLAEQRETEALKCVCTIALIGIVLFSLGASSFLYAIHAKSELDEKNRPAQSEKMGKLGEVDRGPRGKNEVALTFDTGAEAECFESFIAATLNTVRYSI